MKLLTVICVCAFLLGLMNGKVSSLKCYSTQGEKIQDCLLNGPQFQCATIVSKSKDVLKVVKGCIPNCASGTVSTLDGLSTTYSCCKKDFCNTASANKIISGLNVLLSVFVSFVLFK